MHKHLMQIGKRGAKPRQYNCQLYLLTYPDAKSYGTQKYVRLDSSVCVSKTSGNNN